MIELSRERPRYAKEIIPRTMRKTELLLQANQFRKRLSSVKEGICLLAGDWYPYDSMSSIASLDGFLKGELAALRQLTGNDPVLDIGCGDGDVAFFLESLGCPVRVIDHPPTNNNHMYGVEALKCALRSKVEIQAADLDRRIDLPDPHYGLTLLLGILYHLKNPYAILEALAKKSRYCFLSTRIASLSPDKKTHFGDLPVAYLLDEAETNQDETNYWIFSEAGLRRILRRTGWDVKQYRAVGNATASDPVSAAGDARAYCSSKAVWRIGPTAFVCCMDGISSNLARGDGANAAFRYGCPHRRLASPPPFASNSTCLPRSRPRGRCSR